MATQPWQTGYKHAHITGAQMLLGKYVFSTAQLSTTSFSPSIDPYLFIFDSLPSLVCRPQRTGLMNGGQAGTATWTVRQRS